GTVGAGGGFGRGGGAGAAGGASTTGAATTTPVRPPVSAAQQKALTACASLRPTGGFGAGGAGGGFGGGGGFNSSNPAFAKFTACLKQHGIPAGSTASRTSPAYQTAFAACRSLLPSGGLGFGRGGGAGGQGGAANGATFAKYQACLKAHGVQTGAAGQSATKLQAAITACRSVLPGAGRGSSQPTTTAPTTTG
ncbi:MAG TPA: hypothetical protein VMV08_04085, partial [Gaiellaceae bacterium]|nr:hypothetical protein [Gaiellaceae bacterium]